MNSAQVDRNFWRGKRVFLTGHTGFKGSWLSLWLKSMGANVTGYALTPNTRPNLYNVLGVEALIDKSILADIRDLDRVRKEMIDAAPDVLIHMAAQPLVRYSYSNPVETYATNVMGTVNVLESMRSVDSIRATIIVTTDKCYENKEWVWGYRENDSLGGHDPYSNSKGCAEMVASAYRVSYFSNQSNGNCISTARAGNVIGGGDWSADRLIPDILRSIESNDVLKVRNPLATRPWQHVLEPLAGYLMLAQALYAHGSEFSNAWNFGPQDSDVRSVGDVIELFSQSLGKSISWANDGSKNLHEANVLKLDCSKSKTRLGWLPIWSLEIAINKIIEWNSAYQQDISNIQDFSLMQIDNFEKQRLSAIKNKRGNL